MKKLPIKKLRLRRSGKTPVANKSLSFKQGISLLVIVTLGLFGVSGYYWFQNIFSDPNRIISDMLDKSMQTTSVYRSVVQDNGQSNVNQNIFMSFTPKVVAQSVTDLKENSQIGETNVTTETLGTKDTDFVRYTSIDVRNSPVKRDFSKVVNQWSKRVNNPQTGEGISFLNDALFVAVPFGNLDQNQRTELKNEINKVNLYQYTNAKREFVSGRPVMNYTIQLDPKALVTVLAKYVQVTGVGAGAVLDPTAYEGAAKIQLQLKVDMLSRHINTIDFVSSGRKESYHGYNVAHKIDLPTKTIGTDELQTRLQALENQQ
jgi:hypothetical protein